MISSLTNKYKTSVVIDRIMIKDEIRNCKYITTQPQKVSKQVENYYKQAFKKRKTNFGSLNKSWKDQYEPRPYINQQ